MFRQEGVACGLRPAWTGFPQFVELEALGQAPLASCGPNVCQVAVHGVSSIVRVVPQRIEPIRVPHEEGLASGYVAIFEGCDALVAADES